MRKYLYFFFVKLAFIRSGGSGTINIFDDLAAMLYRDEYDNFS